MYLRVVFIKESKIFLFDSNTTIFAFNKLVIDNKALICERFT